MRGKVGQVGGGVGGWAHFAEQIIVFRRFNRGRVQAATTGVNRFGHFGQRVNVAQIKFNVGFRSVFRRQLDFSRLLRGHGRGERGALAADELKGFGDGLAFLVVLRFGDAVLVNLDRYVVEGEHGFHHRPGVFFLFVVAQQETHDLVVGGGGLGHGLVSSRLVERIVALLALLRAERVVHATIGTGNANDVVVLFLATKHELARLWAVDSLFKTEGLSLGNRFNLHPYDDEGPTRG